MIMISFTFDKEKAQARARNDRIFSSPDIARTLCCKNDAAIHFEDGNLTVLGSDIHVSFDDVNFMSATIVNDK